MTVGPSQPSLPSGEIRVGRAMIEGARRFALDHAELLARLVNDARRRYEEALGQPIEPVSVEQVRARLEELFDEPYIGLNLAALVHLARSLTAAEDYETFIVDEILGVAIAEIIAAREPHRSFAVSAFHILDALIKDEINQVVDRRNLAVDDLLAGLAAGLEATLPGWRWMREPPKPKE